MKQHGAENQDVAKILIPLVKEALQDVIGQTGRETTLLTPEELAKRLKVPVSWVYEQSRQGNIPTHRIGRYIRFNLREVIESQEKKK